MKKFDIVLGDKKCPRCDGRAEVSAIGRLYKDDSVKGNLVEAHPFCRWRLLATPIPAKAQETIRAALAQRGEVPKPEFRPRDPSEPTPRP